MDSKIYNENIEEVLQMCWNNTNSSLPKKINSTNNYNNFGTSFAMKSFQTMYNQFLYKKSLRQKTVEEKKDDIQFIKSFEDLDKLNQTIEEESIEEK